MIDTPGPLLHADIHLDRLRANVDILRTHVPAHVHIMGVVKCDAYGHGAIPIARTLTACGIQHLVAGSVMEGIALRRAGISAPILVLSDPLHHSLQDAATYDLTLTVADEQLVPRLARLQPGKAVSVHLKINTGLCRFGVDPDQVEAVLHALSKISHVRVEGVYSHLSSTFRDDTTSDAITRQQIGTFMQVCTQLERQGMLPPMVHIGSSTALLGFPDEVCAWPCNALRVGTIVYGFLERPNAWKHRPRPIAELTTRIVQIRQVRAGTRVGYHGAYRMPQHGRIAVVHGGYSHGVHGDLGKGYQPLVRGRSATFIGKPSLAQSLLDLGEVPDAHIGDPVLMAGESVNIHSVAQVLGRSTWELLTPMLQASRKTYLQD